MNIKNSSLQKLLQSKHFVTIAEIAASINHGSDKIITDAKNLLQHNLDVVAFSDQALVKSEYFKLSELVALDVFSKLPEGVSIPVIKARTKSKKEVTAITKSLKAQKIKNLFVVTGDSSSESAETIQTSLEVLPSVSLEFFTGAVAHPLPNAVLDTLSKIEAGAQFLIMQATYDNNEWSQWVEAIKTLGIHKKVPLLAVVMPVTSLRMLSVIQNIQDVSVPPAFVSQFVGLNESEVRMKGLVIAKKTIAEYKKIGIFSGIYIYSKSQEITIELANFIRNQNTKKSND